VTTLTRHKDPPIWRVYLNEIGKRAGVPLHVDQWEWIAAFRPNPMTGSAILSV
jgi:hypothetical protein